MKKQLLIFLFVLFLTPLFAQDYPFQDPRLDDETRLDNLISLMTPDEKIRCLSTRPSIPRLGVEGTHTVEGLHGLALSGPANWAVKGPGASATTTFPQSIGLAQTWDPELLQQIASLEAEEARYLTQSPKYGSAGLIVFAPNADIGRDIRWGRTEECYGEDAFLAAEMTVAYVKGLQGGHPKYWKTASLMKHFLANSNENERTRNSSDFDERLFREYYGYAFYKGITEGGSRAYMAAYNKYNGIPCTVHPVLKSVTVEEWGQNGIIATDGGAYRQLVTEHRYFPDLETAAVGCIHAGITMFLDNYQQPLQNALSKGLVTQEEIDRAVRGTLRVLLKLGKLDDSAENPYSKIGITDTIDIWDKPETHQLARKATVKSVVLMKNENQLLPLDKKKIKTLAVIGPSANMVVSDWYAGTPPYQVTALEGIRNAVGDDVKVLFAQSNKADSAVIAASQADVAIVCVGNHPLCNGLGWAESYVYSNGKEAIDREAISLEQEDLVKVVKAANPKTIMVVVSSFPYSINWSKEHVLAILHIAQSSQELGNGLADILFGKESPAGRLVQTWSASMDHLPPILDYNIHNGRTYMYDPHEALFPFGHGLTYTTFDYAGMKIEKPFVREGEKIDITVTLKNTGGYDSDEVVQLYVSFPDSKVERPAKALKGFKRVFVPEGQTMEVTIQLDSEDLTYWDVEKQAFVLEKGKVKFFVGPSSIHFPLMAEMEVK